MSPIFTWAADLWREMREEFELSVEAAHAAAEEGTGGAMLNKHGRAEGIDAYSLMTGPWSRVERYGSPELIEWCQTEGRPSVARFEREWFASWLGEMPLPDAPMSEFAVGDRVQFRLEPPPELGWPTQAPWPSLQFSRVEAVHDPTHPSVDGGEYRYALRASEGAELLLPSTCFVRAAD